MDDTNKNIEPSKGEPAQQGEAPLSEGFEEAGVFAPLTAEYLLERGYCCGNGCKNCPYDYKAVPEPRRSKLLAERKKNESDNNVS
jgi:hypothetical protein